MKGVAGMQGQKTVEGSSEDERGRRRQGWSGDTKGEEPLRGQKPPAAKTPEAKHAPKSPESPKMEELASLKLLKKLHPKIHRQHKNQLILALRRCHPVAKELRLHMKPSFLIKYLCVG